MFVSEIFQVYNETVKIKIKTIKDLTYKTLQRLVN